MKTIDVADFEPEAVVTELLDGGGAVRFPGLFGDEQIAEARDIVAGLTSDEAVTGARRDG